MYDVLYISMEGWGTVWRRNQNVAAGLARRISPRKLLYVTLPNDLSHAARKGRWGNVKRWLFASPPAAAPEAENVFVFSPTKYFPNSLFFCRLLNEWLERLQIRRAARAVGLANPVLYINPYSAAHLPGRMGEQCTVYDVGDDWTAFRAGRRLERLILKQDVALTRLADAVVVVSQRLVDLKRALAPAERIHQIPNGVDVARYRAVVGGRRDGVPEAAWSRPVIGHTGTLQSQRTNVPLVIAVARAFPTGTVVLVGPNDLDSASLAQLLAEPNIRITGPVPYASIPQVMDRFDVCFVPHHVTSFTDSQSPLKLFEYLAAGLPIVSTPVSGFRDYPELVHLAATEADFVEAIYAALQEPAATRAARRAEAERHSWDARLSAITAVIEKARQRRRGVVTGGASGVARLPSLDPTPIADQTAAV